MPFDLREIASISGMPGLYKIVAPTRNGIIVESLTEKPARSVAQARNRVSILQEISMYTNDEEHTVPLAEIFDRIRKQYGSDLPVTSKSSTQELSAFLESVLPDYDQERVYASDMKKLAQWYVIVNQFVPYSEEAASDAAGSEAPQETASAAE
ncbi:DUF5606 domain-containing protein [Rufibacter glacialis]|uniref:DUF5606 domain-containing protein n=1 Tax=Rufibacter glacialis TaxID=1259555 RepID=A0A5M8QNB6_9BACT|nr:DUF5606 domain-containing protein [Rufibacter glacialis]KAA6435692.1 hypothetical protein FOE74_07045 [Rufibacter glacialis]GGK65685.1 hypothetical protein GCM10011405_12070 [Rufibacter glacialis]